MNIVKYGLLTFAMLVGLLTASIGYFLYAENKVDARIEGNQLGEVKTLQQGGIHYRDLNKNGRLDAYENPAAEFRTRIENLLSLMTVEEKVGLMFHAVGSVGPNASLTEAPKVSDNPVENWVFKVMMHGNLPRSLIVRHINHFNLINSLPAEDMIRWHNAAQKAAARTRLGIPISFSTDPRHSFRDAPGATSIVSVNMSQWPDALGFAALDDVEVTKQFGRIANLEYRALGLRTALHPMADLATDPRWGRNIGTFGEDADLSSRHIYAYIKGFQGEQIDRTSVLAVTKHFPGGGAVKDGHEPHFHHGRHQGYPGNNFDYLLKPFKAAFAAGSAQIMTSYGIPTGQTDEEVAMSFNRWILTDLLRDNLGFEGVALADWNVVTPLGAWRYIGYKPARSWGVETLSVKQRFAKALHAGIDQFGGEIYPEPLIEMVVAGQISEDRIDQSARRILLDKFRLGLFDDPYLLTEGLEEKLQVAENIALGRRAQRQSQVLLKNNTTTDNSPILPLAQGIKVYVEGFKSELLADYAQQVDSPEAADVAILNMKAPAGKPQLRASIQDTLFEQFFRQGNLDFEVEVQDHIRGIMEKVPTVVTMYLDRPAVIPHIAKEAAGLLVNFGGTDDAILDVLFGDASPKGRLPFEMPSSMAAVLEQYEDTPYDSKDPLFPFGFGLEYQSMDEVVRNKYKTQ